MEVAAKHSVMEVFLVLFFSYLCGGECFEDINALIGQFKQRPGTLLPSADTVGRGLKELAEENIIYMGAHWKAERSEPIYKPTTLRSSLNKHHFFVAFHTSPLVWVGDFMTMQEPRIPENPHING